MGPVGSVLCDELGQRGSHFCNDSINLRFYQFPCVLERTTARGVALSKEDVVAAPLVNWRLLSWGLDAAATARTFLKFTMGEQRRALDVASTSLVCTLLLV
jgi:hypothetical protein